MSEDYSDFVKRPKTMTVAQARQIYHEKCKIVEQNRGRPDSWLRRRSRRLERAEARLVIKAKNEQEKPRGICHCGNAVTRRGNLKCDACVTKDYLNQFADVGEGCIVKVDGRRYRKVNSVFKILCHVKSCSRFAVDGASCSDHPIQLKVDADDITYMQQLCVNQDCDCDNHMYKLNAYKKVMGQIGSIRHILDTWAQHGIAVDVKDDTVTLSKMNPPIYYKSDRVVPLLWHGVYAVHGDVKSGRFAHDPYRISKKIYEAIIYAKRGVPPCYAIYGERNRIGGYARRFRRFGRADYGGAALADIIDDLHEIGDHEAVAGIIDHFIGFDEAIDALDGGDHDEDVVEPVDHDAD
jgi:hypothetical protein